MLVPRTAVVLERTLRRRAHALELALPPTGPVDDAPGPGRTEVVAVRFAKRCRIECFSLQLLVVSRRIDLESKPQLRESRTYARALIRRPIRELDRFTERTIRFVEAPSPEEGVAEISEDLRREAGRLPASGPGRAPEA